MSRNHNIMNLDTLLLILGTKTVLKYSCRICDLENPQTGTHFRKLRLDV